MVRDHDADRPPTVFSVLGGGVEAGMTKDTTRELPMATLGKLKSSVICPHNPTCASAEDCIKRTMEYCMGKRKTP